MKISKKLTWADKNKQICLLDERAGKFVFILVLSDRENERFGGMFAVAYCSCGANKIYVHVNDDKIS